MGKHIDNLGSLENFKAPWETDAGEVEIDKDRLKRYIYNLSLDKATAQDARDETAEAVTKAEQELNEAKAEVAKGDPTGKIAELETKLAKAQSDAQTAQGNLDRLEVGIEKGLTPKQAARLQGATRAELEKDADEILETFGVKPPNNDETDDEREEREEREAEEAEQARQQPRPVTGLINPADPKAGSGGQEIDFEKAADQIMGRGVYLR